MDSFSWDDLTESEIHQNTTSQVFSRGDDYYRQGAVASLVRRGSVLQAEVEGSDYEPYRVAVTLGPNGVEDATCTCPYDWGGWCKHIVAVMLAVLNEPESVDEQPSLESLLAPLSRDQLQSLLLKLAARNPDLSDGLAAHVALLEATSATAGAVDAVASPEATRDTAPPGTAAPLSTPVDPQPFRRQVRSIIHGSDRMHRYDDYWGGYRHAGAIVDEVRQVLDEACVFLHAGDGRNALLVLEAITDEYIKHWMELDDSDGDASAFLDDLASVWTEAILAVDLTSQEREAWGKKLKKWNREIADYTDGGFEAAMEATRQHWDDAPLVRVLQGEDTDSIWEDEPPWYADELTEARLNVLERQGRYREAMHLAKAEEHIGRYVEMLAKLGQVQEAVEFGLEHLTSVDEAHFFARSLCERDAIDEALRIAEHGLTLQSFNKAPLAVWLRDLAARHGRTEQAVRAAVVAVRESPDLNSYRRAQELAGDNWPPLREDLLKHLRQKRMAEQTGPVDIFLHERLYDDALKVVKNSWDYTLIGRVVDAVLDQRPNEVIPICRKQAEEIMNGGKSEHYDTAVRWLRRAKTAFQKAGRENEWETYLDELLSRHQKKWKLRPMLQALRTQ